jgi:two-component system sensor histidine kinase YesM
MTRKRKYTLTLPNIKNQISLIFLLSSVVPICIFGLFAIVNARSQMLEQYKTQLNADATRVNSSLFEITTSVITNIQSITEVAECRSLFDHKYVESDSTRYSYLDSSLKNYRSNTTAISSIHIYTNNPSIPVSNYISYSNSNYADTDWYTQIGKTNYSTWFCSTALDRFSKPYYELTLVYRIPLGTQNYTAYVVTKLDSNYLRNRLILNNHVIFSSIDNEKVFFSSNRSRIWTDMIFPSDFDYQNYQYTGPLKIGDETLLTSIVTFLPYKTDNRFYISVSDSDAYSNINQITFIYGVILLFATVVPTLIILLFSSYFSRRIQILKRAMHQTSMGDYNIIEQFRGDDELAETFSDLKKTVDLIHAKEAEFYESKITEQKLINTQQQIEFKMLASQINPHFLYNTLETIRMQAISSGNRNIADSIHLLGKTMHYVLENTGTDSTTLAKEVDHIQTYLAIQQLRFGDRVNYTIHIPPYLDLEQFRILPLLLQPIVENAIVHGLEGVTQNGQIEIEFILEEPNLYITIHDNGEGMDEKETSLLRTNISEHGSLKTASSIGLRNINQRLCLLYGNHNGLQIESRPLVGTTITLTLPLEQMIDTQALSDILVRREQYWSQDIDI